MEKENKKRWKNFGPKKKLGWRSYFRIHTQRISISLAFLLELTFQPGKSASTSVYRRVNGTESACESVADDASDEQKSSRDSPIPRISEPASPAALHKFAHRRILFPLRRRYVTSKLMFFEKMIEFKKRIWTYCFP